jgi:hypothetical protein
MTTASAARWARTKTVRAAFGTFGTSILFLGMILAVVTYLSVTNVDKTEGVQSRDPDPDPQADPDRVPA